MQQRLVLGGMKHCGKSTHGKLLAARLGVPFFDTDTLLEERFAALYGRRAGCREIFREAGEAAFRELEAAVIAELAAESGRPQVVALGGGAPANERIVPETWAKLGCFIYLETAPEVAFERVKQGGLPPFLVAAADPYRAFLDLYRDRAAFYRRYAALIIPVAADIPVETVQAQILEELRKHE